MAGKNTYLHGMHHTRTGLQFESVVIGDVLWREIKEALNRELTIEEKKAIEVELYKINTWRMYPQNLGVTTQSALKTLTALSKLTEASAEKAYKDCDIHTHSLIQDSLIAKIKADGTDLLYPTGALIQKAALYAYDQLLKRPKSAGGRSKKTYQLMLADYIVSCWAALGGEGNKAYFTDSVSISPMAKFGTAIFTAVEGDSFDPASAAKLIRKAIQRKESVR